MEHPIAFPSPEAPSARYAVVLNGEDYEAYTELQHAYYRDFTPAGPVESALVDQLVAATWRIRRFAAMESAAIDHAADSQRAELDATYERLDLATRYHFAFDQLVTNSDVLANYSRFEVAQTRLYSRSLRQLLALQRKKRRNEPNPDGPPRP